MYSLGFEHFTVYYGNHDLRTLTFWKKWKKNVLLQ
jgi:hypothetical protein